MAKCVPLIQLNIANPKITIFNISKPESSPKNQSTNKLPGLPFSKGRASLLQRENTAKIQVNKKPSHILTHSVSVKNLLLLSGKLSGSNGKLKKETSRIVKQKKIPLKCSYCSNFSMNMMNKIIKKNTLLCAETFLNNNARNAINYIIFNVKCKLVAIFKDYLIYNDTTEFLRRIYTKEEAKIRIKNAYEFYSQNSHIIPTFARISDNNFYLKNKSRKNKLIQIKNEELQDKENTSKITTFLKSKFVNSLLDDDLRKKSIDSAFCQEQSENDILNLLNNFKDCSNSHTKENKEEDFEFINNSKTKDKVMQIINSQKSTKCLESYHKKMTSIIKSIENSTNSSSNKILRIKSQSNLIRVLNHSKENYKGKYANIYFTKNPNEQRPFIDNINNTNELRNHKLQKAGVYSGSNDENANSIKTKKPNTLKRDSYSVKKININKLCTSLKQNRPSESSRLSSIKKNIKQAISMKKLSNNTPTLRSYFTVKNVIKGNHEKIKDLGKSDKKRAKTNLFYSNSSEKCLKLKNKAQKKKEEYPISPKKAMEMARSERHCKKSTEAHTAYFTTSRPSTNYKANHVISKV